MAHKHILGRGGQAHQEIWFSFTYVCWLAGWLAERLHVPFCIYNLHCVWRREHDGHSHGNSKFTIFNGIYICELMRRQQQQPPHRGKNVFDKVVFVCKMRYLLMARRIFFFSRWNVFRSPSSHTHTPTTHSLSGIIHGPAEILQCDSGQQVKMCKTF